MTPLDTIAKNSPLEREDEATWGACFLTQLPHTSALHQLNNMCVCCEIITSNFAWSQTNMNPCISRINVPSLSIGQKDEQHWTGMQWTKVQVWFLLQCLVQWKISEGGHFRLHVQTSVCPLPRVCQESNQRPEHQLGGDWQASPGDRARKETSQSYIVNFYKQVN